MNDNMLYLKELNEQGKTLFSCDKYQEAIKKYEKAISVDPMYIDTYFNACEAYIMADKFDEAKDMMNKVLLIEKNNGIAYFHLGNISLLEEKFDEGQLYYAKAINNGYDNSQIYMNLASVAEENDDYEKAVEMYTKAIARDKLFYPAKIRRIQIYMAVNKNVEALNSCDDLIETNPNIFEGHHLKFVILATSNRFEEAEKVLDKAQKMFPDDQGFILDRVKLYELQNKLQDALELIETIDTAIVPIEVISIEKSNLYLALGKVKEAKDLLETCSSSKENSQVERSLLIIYLDEKEYENVLKSSNKIIKMEEYDSAYFMALYYKAFSLKMLGRNSEAVEEYKNALQIMQQACSINSGVLDLYIYRAICYNEIGNIEKALEMIDYIETVDENNAETHYLKYLIYKESDPDRSLNELKIAKTNNPEVAKLFSE